MLGGDGSQPPMRRRAGLLAHRDRASCSAVSGAVARALETAFARHCQVDVRGRARDRDRDRLRRRSGANNSSRRRRFRIGDVGPAVGRNLIGCRGARGHQPAAPGARSRSDVRKRPPIRAGASRSRTRSRARNVGLTAVLDERLAPSATRSPIFKVGQILQLNATAHGRVRVECNGEPLLWCQLGKSQRQAYTLRVDEPIDREQEFVE